MASIILLLDPKFRSSFMHTHTSSQMQKADMKRHYKTFKRSIHHIHRIYPELTNERARREDGGKRQSLFFKDLNKLRYGSKWITRKEKKKRVLTSANRGFKFVIKREAKRNDPSQKTWPSNTEFTWQGDKGRRNVEYWRVHTHTHNGGAEMQMPSSPRMAF